MLNNSNHFSVQGTRANAVLRVKENHSHIRYLEALLAIECEERDRHAVNRTRRFCRQAATQSPVAKWRKLDEAYQTIVKLRKGVVVLPRGADTADTATATRTSRNASGRSLRGCCFRRRAPAAFYWWFRAFDRMWRAHSSASAVRCFR